MEHPSPGKNIFCSDVQLGMWRAVLLWQEVSQNNKNKTEKQTKRKEKCFLSDKEDVLRDGCSVELEAVQTWSHRCCDATVPLVWFDSEVKSRFTAVVRQRGAVCRCELRREDTVSMFCFSLVFLLIS